MKAIVFIAIQKSESGVMVLRGFDNEKGAKDFCTQCDDTVMGYKNAFLEYKENQSDENKARLEERLQELTVLTIFDFAPSKRFDFSYWRVPIW